MSNFELFSQNTFIEDSFKSSFELSFVDKSSIVPVHPHEVIQRHFGWVASTQVSEETSMAQTEQSELQQLRERNAMLERDISELRSEIENVQFRVAQMTKRVVDSEREKAKLKLRFGAEKKVLEQINAQLKRRLITSQREKAQMKLQVAANIQKNLLLQQNTTKLTKRIVDTQREKAQLILRFKNS